MELNYFRCYHSYRKKLDGFSDEEVGRLFRALLEYSETGQHMELTDWERTAFNFLAADIDEDKAKQEKIHDARSKAGKASGVARASKVPIHVNKTNKTNKTNICQQNEHVLAKGTNVNFVQPEGKQQDYGFGEELESVFRDWLEYKKEKRQGYKDKGLAVLLGQVKKYSAEYGDQAVIDLMRESMANGWQGVMWKNIKSGTTAKAKPDNVSPSKIVSPIGQNGWMKKYIDARKDG